MSKQAGWARREENASLELKSSELFLQLHAQVWGGSLSRLTERKKLRKSRLELAAGQGERAAYHTVRYGTWLPSLILLLRNIIIRGTDSVCAANYMYLDYSTLTPSSFSSRFLLIFTPCFVPTSCKI